MVQSAHAWGWTIEAHHEPWQGDLALQRIVGGNMRRWKMEGYTHLLRLDAFDMVMIGPPSELEEKMAIYNNPPLICSAECGCWPASYRMDEYPERLHPWWFAHSPLTFDLRQDAPVRYWQMPERGYGTDQYHLADLVIEGVIPIDRGQHIVMSAAHVNPFSDAFVIEGDRVFNKLTGGRGLVLHGNGRTDISWAPKRARTQL